MPEPQIVTSAHGTAAQALGLTAVQLHGDTAADVVLEAAKEIEVVIQVVSAPDLAELTLNPVLLKGNILMVDAPNPGGGKAFDGDLVGDLADRHRVLLAGGLNPGNVAAAISAVGPWGVDVATGVERPDGSKHPELIREFVASARGA